MDIQKSLRKVMQEDASTNEFMQKQINQMKYQTNIAMYYNAKINGGEYKDKHTLSDKQMPDNKMALRNTLNQSF